MSKIEEYYQRKEQHEHLEHRDVLLAIGVLLKSKEGREVLTYLFKNLDVGSVPEEGLEGMLLHNRIGFLRAGNSIYKLACEADFEEAAKIMAKIERMKYDDLCEQHRINHSNDTE